MEEKTKKTKIKNPYEVLPLEEEKINYTNIDF